MVRGYRSKIADYCRQGAVGILLLAAATLTGYLFRSIRFTDTDIVIVYILAVILTARFTTGYAFGVFTAVLSNFSFNYFFTDPYYSFAINNPSYVITLLIMTVTAIITSTLTSKVKLHDLQASEKEKEARTLYALTRRLSDARDREHAAMAVIESVSSYLGCRAAYLGFTAEGMPEKQFLQRGQGQDFTILETRDEGHFKRFSVFPRPESIKGTEFSDWPVYGQDRLLGLIRIPVSDAEEISDETARLLRSMSETIGIAVERLIFFQEKIRDQELIVQERYRANLLRAISHDLRTPLSGILGTSEMLMDMTEQADPRHEMVKDIYKDADWLYSLVENILNLTRLQDGRLVLNKEIEAAEEVVDAAVRHITKRAPWAEISVKVPEEVLMVPMDAKLVGQVLVNLMDNAVKHSKAGEKIYVEVKKNEDGSMAEFTVADEGEGIAEKDLPKLFETFYTSQEKHADARQGIGLGLPICESVVEAHGGTITGGNREGMQGAYFRFTLPMKEDIKVE